MSNRARVYWFFSVVLMTVSGSAATWGAYTGIQSVSPPSKTLDERILMHVRGAASHWFTDCDPASEDDCLAGICHCIFPFSGGPCDGKSNGDFCYRCEFTQIGKWCSSFGFSTCTDSQPIDCGNKLTGTCQTQADGTLKCIVETNTGTSCDHSIPDCE
jgi:hypothetical protein